MTSAAAIVKDTALCTTCPKLCRFSCPVAVADGRESSTPTAKMTTAARLAQGRLDYTPENVEPLYRCTGCRLEQEHCKHGIDAASTLEDARALAYAHGAVPDEVRNKEARLRTDGDALQDELRKAAQAVGGAAAADEALFCGCRMLRDDLSLARTSAALLRAVRGTPAAVWDREPMCCGYPLYALGDRSALQRQAKKLERQSRDVKRLTVADPGCAFVLAAIYPKLGVKLRPRIVTLPERLHADRARLPRRTPSRERVVYHDPCHLGRRLGVFDEPRALLAATGATLLTPPWDRATARCSGWGGLYPILDPTHARAIAAVRAAEFESTGATRIVTACPSCKLALGIVGTLPVDDLATAVARATGLSVP